MAQQERALRTRRALIHAAAEVFAGEGYASASITSISRRAGVSNGALHFHFESKRSLARAVEDDALVVVREISERVRHASDGALQQLVDGTYALMGSLSSDVVVRAGFALTGELADPSGESGPRRFWRDWVGEVLVRAKGEGLLADGVSVEDATAALVAVTVGFEVLGSRDREWLSEARVRSFWGLLLPRLADPRSGVQAVPEWTPAAREATGAY